MAQTSGTYFQKNNMYDLTIVGNGIIGLLIANEYKKIEPKAKVALIGPATKDNSGTMASGAMINVMPEIDTMSYGDEYYQKKIGIGLKSTKKWNTFFKKKFLPKDIKVANHTIVYREKNGPTYEKNIYEKSKFNCKKNNKILDKKVNFFGKKKDYFIIKDEIAINSNKLIWILEKKIKNKVDFIDSCVNSIKSVNSNNYQKIFLNNKKIIYSKKVLICCGFNSGKIMKSINKNSIDILSSIGDAFHVSKAKNFLNKLPEKYVVRTTNRGSSCGLHIVPLSKDKFYLGSSSNLSFNPNNEGTKYGSIEYILSTFKKEMFQKTNSLLIKSVRGFRTLSIDGLPSIGPLNKNIYVITGTFRDGLTNAPYYCDLFLNWISQNENKDSKIEEWSPLRQPTSYGTQSNSIEEYVDTKLCGLIEHNAIINKKIATVKNELYYEAKKIYKKLESQKKIKKKFSVHPLILNLYK